MSAVPGEPQRPALDELLDTAPCGFLSFDDDGTIRLANATLLDLLGYARDDLVGRHVETLLTVAGRIFYQTHFFPLLRLHGRAEEIFLLLRHRDGGEVGALVNGVRRERDGACANDCALMVVRERRKYEDALLQARRTAEQARAEMEAQKEVVERANELLEQQGMELELQHQQLEEQALELERQRALAEEANRAKSQFLANMSHELRTPLNAIAGYVQLLELGVHGAVTPGQLDALGRVARAQRHLLRLINEVLNLARIEAGRVDYASEPVPLHELVAATLPLVEPQLAAAGLACRVEVAPGLVARADRDKVQQILLNLLTNAIKFTPAGGLTVWGDAAAADAGAAGMVRLAVRDTGIGIPADRLPSVFEPFVQVRAELTRTAEGTGLGLAISRDLARGMGGELTAESAPGTGSTFVLTLPRLDDPGAAG